jgi:hypothetical protein
MHCRGVQRLAISAYLSRFLFSLLLRIAPHCVPGGIRVVSISCSYPPNTDGQNKVNIRAHRGLHVTHVHRRSPLLNTGRDRIVVKETTPGSRVV